MLNLIAKVNKYICYVLARNFLLFFVLSGLALCCGVMFLLTILLESLKLLNLYLVRKANQSPLVYAKTEKNINTRDPLVVPLLFPASLWDVKKRR